MRKSSIAATVLLLAACGTGDAPKAGENGADSATASSAAGTGAGPTMQPGLWEVTVQTGAIEIPNMPKGVQMPMAAPTTVRSCLTAEQVASPNANFLSGKDDRAGCTGENMSVAGGRIQGVVNCSTPEGRMRATMDGRYTATSYELTQQIETHAQGMTVNMENRVSARRVGECPAQG